MKNTGDSLSGQNKGRRTAGVGSSPTLPTKLQRTRLWNQLRKLDRQYGRICAQIGCSIPFAKLFSYNEKLVTKLGWIDQIRKKIRNKLKGYVS